MNVALAALFSVLLAAPPPVETPPTTESDAAGLEALLDSANAADRVRGVKRLLRRAKAHPGDFVALEGGARALFLRSTWETERSRGAKLAKRCWRAADALVAKFPDKAHGYYWAALCIGQYAKNSSLETTLGQGLLNKMKASANASITHDANLYAMGAQRLLGCFYARAPWPVGDNDKAFEYLVVAEKADPTDANGLLCLSEALSARGDTAGARAALKTCAASHTRDTATIAVCAERLAN